LRGLLLSERRGNEEERGEREREGKVKGRKMETRWREGYFPPKNFDVAPLCQTLGVLMGPLRREEGREREGGEKNGNGKEGRKEEKGSGAKLEQGRRLAKAGPVWGSAASSPSGIRGGTPRTFEIWCNLGPQNSLQKCLITCRLLQKG